MENAADALKMAGSLLLFILALSLAILAFSQARETIDVVLKNTDREYLTIEGDSRFYYLANSNDTKRYVGKETIIPTLYRAYKESYKIIFEFPDGYYLYEKNGEQVSKIDLLEQSIHSDLASRQFLDGLLYKDYDYNDTGKSLSDFQTYFNIKPNTSMGLYDYLTSREKNYNIEESLGTYYIEDLASDPTDTSGGASVEEINKKEKRVITYRFIK